MIDKKKTFEIPSICIGQYMSLLTPEEFKILIYAIRQMSDNRDRISVNQFCNGFVDNESGKRLNSGTGLGESAIRKALKNLVRFGLLVILMPPDSSLSLGPKYCFQNNASEVDLQALQERFIKHREKCNMRAEKMRSFHPVQPVCYASNTRKQWSRIRKTISEIIFNRDGRICKNCGSTDNLTIDHILPISRGGTNCIRNLQVLCFDCNVRKGTNLEQVVSGKSEL